jgi:hypothetical protein
LTRSLANHQEESMIQGRLGLTMPEVERLTGREWLPVTPEDDYDGPGAYVWVSDDGKEETIYPGKSRYVLARLAAEAAWSEDADHIGYEAFSRLVCRYAASALYTRTASEGEARDVEALIAAGTIHLTGHPPLAWGGAWPPRTPRGITASEIAIRWAQQEMPGGEAA